MRYIGNKTNLLDRIYYALKENGVNGKSFFDVFSGTASVAKFFKQKGFQIYSSDLLYMSYCLQRAYIQNNDYPQFSHLIKKIQGQNIDLFNNPIDIVLDYLNNIKPIKGFIYQNYSIGGTKNLSQPRMYLSDNNAQKIDAVRIQIENWKKKQIVTEDEYFILLACLLESVSLFSNVSGVYAAFQKKWDPRALKTFIIKPIKICINKEDNQSFNANSIDLINIISADIFYLDPPYNERQYAPNYHLLETIAKYDNPEIHGITGMRNYSYQKSNFCKKDTALKELDFIVKNAKCNYLVMSYNNEGIMPQKDILKVFWEYGKVTLVEFDYNRFKSNSKTDTKPIHEQLYIVNKYKK